jgi:hypothetical protein
MLACTQFKLHTIRISIILQPWNQWLNLINDHIIDYNHRILLLCEKHCSHILVMHFISRWHVNKKNGIIFSLQVFIHMASMIDFIHYCISHKGFSIYKSCVWIYFFQIMVIEMLFNNKIQILCFEMN